MDEIKKILILGASGMLGSMVYKYFREKKFFLTKGTVRNKNDFSFDSSSIYHFVIDENVYSQLLSIVNDFTPDYIINCTGIINKYCRNDNPAGIKRAIRVNAYFPHELTDFCNQYLPDTMIIQIATDCVFDGSKGNYSEDSLHNATDVYGKTKSLGEVISKNFLNVRCSIIGPEIKNKNSLLEWFLSHPNGSIITGYAHHKWNGVTTLQFAKYCEELINKNLIGNYLKYTNIIHYCPNKAVTKFQLLNIFKDVFRKDYIIEYDDKIGVQIDRTLTSKYTAQGEGDMRKAIEELKTFIDDNHYYSNSLTSKI
jgi:dTDP-4-dehydrorhamnose reductase